MTTAKQDITRHKEHLGATAKEIAAIIGWNQKTVENWFRNVPIKADPYNAIMAITKHRLLRWRMKQ